MRFAVFGMGGSGREVAPLLRSHDEGVVFVDDREDRPASVNGIPVISFEQLTNADHRDRQVVIAVGDSRTREKIERRLDDAGLALGSVIAPTARVLDSVSIGPGAVLCDNVIVTSNVTIGRNCQVNIFSYIAHDCVLGDYVTLAPRVTLNGNVRVDDYAYIGAGALFVQGTKDSPLVIGKGAIVGMGAVVTKPVEPFTLVVGNPARPVRQLTNPEDG
jgi:sugar O-acyltransferase (sialic acid O-acetyltransferase NeuD family)